MANNPTVGVFIPSTYLNAVNTPYFTGQGDAYGNIYPSGLTPGKQIQIGDQAASSLTNPAGANQLFGGTYQFIQVDSGATAANVNAGLGAFLKLDPGGAAGVEPEQGYANMIVTSQDQADSNNLFAGVFINAVTPGNYGFIFVGGGRVEVTYGTLTNGSPVLGDQVVVKASNNGKFDDPTTQTTISTLTVGYAVTAPATNGTSAIYMADIIQRIPAV
jgi:hypothetical protein